MTATTTRTVGMKTQRIESSTMNLAKFLKTSSTLEKRMKVRKIAMKVGRTAKRTPAETYQKKTGALTND